ncbi:MAG TPA: hypothetical protein VHO47_05175 [Candidatus Babeliales bacterium]|nr:hypothetical protein [Candidatus Babeliales bacterium]
MHKLYKKAVNYFSHHVMLGHTVHFAGGFGLALLLQYYVQGSAFLPPVVGWVLLAISLAAHILPFA